jgi:hypothetical protein
MIVPLGASWNMNNKRDIKMKKTLAKNSSNRISRANAKSVAQETLNQKVIAAHEEGLSTNLIATRLNMSEKLVDKIVFEYMKPGIEQAMYEMLIRDDLKAAFATNYSKWTKAQKLIVKAFAEGASVEEMAWELVERN